MKKIGILLGGVAILIGGHLLKHKAKSKSEDERLLEWVSKYYTICDKKYNKVRSKDKVIDKEKLLTHIQYVSDIAREIYVESGEDAHHAQKVLKVAAYLHDIEKIKNPKEHAILGVDYVEKNRKFLKENFLLNDADIHQIKDMILFHSKGKYKQHKEKKDKDNEARSDYIKILQDADKISKIYKGKGDAYIDAWLESKYDKKKTKHKKQKELTDRITKRGLNFKCSYQIFKRRFNKYIKDKK